MKQAGGKHALLTAALIVAGIRLWMQVRGKTKTPFSEWAIGWGATFFLLSLLADVYPQGAGWYSMIIVTSDFLMNGATLLEDVSNAITNAGKGKPTLSQSPFGGSSAGSTPANSTVGQALSTIPVSPGATQTPSVGGTVGTTNYQPPHF